MAPRKLASSDSDATMFLADNEDVNPTKSLFPEVPNTTNLAADPRYNKSPPMQKEETVDPSRYPPVIPPPEDRGPGRTLILCFDGTGDQFDVDNSNIVQLVSLLKKDDRTKQLVYYQSGIGTYTAREPASPFTSRIQKILDEMVAWSIDAHVMGGYEFLMENYVTGDKICLFGFSRGAYTARSLAGMLYKVGLLPPGNVQQVPFAYKMYTRADKVGWEQSNEFKKAFSMDVTIEFLGVWDTVSSLGLIPKSLPVATANTFTRTFRHALSLDERRVKFQPNFWNSPTKEESELEQPTTRTIRTDVEEVWFAGCHCDVGGGAVSNKTRHSLARIPLRWMIRECFKTNSGIMFNSDSLFDIGLHPATLHPSVTPRPPPLPAGSHRIRRPPATPIPISVYDLLIEEGKKPHILADSEIPFLGTEEQEELHDAISPKYDQLKINKLWWALEIIPLPQIFQRERGGDDCIQYVWPHIALPRFIPSPKSNGFKVHRSVKMRMMAEFEDERARNLGKKYIPKPQFHVEPIWVD